MIRRGIGVQSFVSAGGGGDADAQAFITAAGITDATQQSAINTLVTDLKGYGIWSKMKAIYPFVGGTSSTHKWNLKDPRDLDAAFRLVFSGGITHSSTGALFNGTNGWGDTFLNANTNLTNGNFHLSFYSRTNNTSQAFSSEIVLKKSYSASGWVSLRTHNKTSGNAGFAAGDDNNEFATASSTTSGFSIGTETSNSLRKLIKNGSVLATNTTTSTTAIANDNLTLMGNNFVSTYSNNECAFASIGDGLTDTEAANFYTSVQKYQTTLGRHVGTPIVADSDAQAFLNAAEITSVTEANAVDKLVTDLKTYGIWTKMKAIYPFVGGTSSTHKWNLKDPRDLDAAFRLVFSGGGNHASTGWTPNGVNGYADTFLIANTSLSTSSAHFAKYNRNNDLVGVQKVDGCAAAAGANYMQQNYVSANGVIGEVGAVISYTQTDTRGLFTINRTATNSQKLFRNNSTIGTSTFTISNIPNVKFYLGARNDNGVTTSYNSYECAFASIGDGLTDTEAANLYTAVQAYQTSLNRQV